MQVLDIRKLMKNGKEIPMGPSEFLCAVHNASVVLTDSFHCTVFSLIFERPIYTFDRPGISMNSRIQTLHKSLGIEQLNYKDIQIDFEVVHSNIIQLQKDSMKYRIQALKINEEEIQVDIEMAVKNKWEDESKRISVIVPIFNAEKYLERCIRSILNQSYVNLEVILIDDGSSDGCGKICDRFAEMDSRVVVIHQKNSGVSEARNNGLECATGEYISFVDADDYITDDYFKEMITAGEGYDVTISSFSEQYEPGTAERNYNKELGESICNKELAISNFIEDCLAGKLYTYTIWGKLYRRSIIDDLRFEKQAYSEDALFIRMLVLRCHSIAFLEHTGYCYYINGGNATNNALKRTETAFGALNMLLAFYKNYVEFMDKKQKTEVHVLLNGSLNAFLRSAIKNKKCFQKSEKEAVSCAHRCIMFSGIDIKGKAYSMGLYWLYRICACGGIRQS